MAGQVRVKVGCRASYQRKPDDIMAAAHAGNYGLTLTHYQTFVLSFLRPDRGRVQTTLTCPGCSKSMGLTLYSRRSTVLYGVLSGLGAVTAGALAAVMVFFWWPTLEPDVLNFGRFLTALPAVLSVVGLFFALYFLIEPWDCKCSHGADGHDHICSAG